MKTIAILGWVACGALLLTCPPIVVEVPVPAPVPPAVTSGHPELRGIKTVGIVITGKDLPAEVAGRVGDELRAAGLTVVDEPPDSQRAEKKVDATFNLTLRTSPIPRTNRIMVSSEAIVRGEAIVPNGGSPVRTPLVLWLGIHAAAADEPAIARGMVEMAVQHARKFTADVRRADPGF